MLVRAFFRYLVGRSAREMSESDLRRPTVVLAPHPDDETLGCGGTVARKRRMGVPVKVVFMTDGAASHTRFLPPSELERLRRGEAVEACARLGVKDVHFMGLPDHKLHLNVARTAVELGRVLEDTPDWDLFVPHRHDGPADHEYTYQIAVRAISDGRNQPRLLEFPIWYWLSWPWVARPGRFSSRRGYRRRYGRALRDCWRGEFNQGVTIIDELPLKMHALRAHATQMERLGDNPRWPILADVAGGGLLVALTQRREVFRLTSHGRHS